MKTSNRTSKLRIVPRRPLTPEEEHRAAFRDLVARASRGDRNAVWAIYFAMRREILAQARLALGPYEADDDDVLQSLMVLLLEGRCPYGADQGPPREWLARTTRMCAHRHRAWLDGQRDTTPLEPPETLRSPGVA